MKKKLLVITAVSAIVIILLITLVIFLSARGDQKKTTFNLSDYNTYIEKYPSDIVLGPIDNAVTAKEKAESVCIEMFGESIIKQQPYKAYFDKETNTRLVTGSGVKTLLGSKKSGVPYIIIQNSDGKVLAVWRERTIEILRLQYTSF